MSMQSIKEKKLLVKFAQSMGQPIDPTIVEEVKKYEEIQQRIQESVRGSFNEIFESMPQVVIEEEPVVVSVVEPEVQEELPPQTEQLVEESLADRAAKAIKVPIREEDT